MRYKFRHLCTKDRTASSLTCGYMLGDMTGELGPDEFIEELFPESQNYACKTVNTRTQGTKTVCKVRGITLNYAASQFVSFDSIRCMILGADDREIITVCTDRKIKRKRRKCDGSGMAGADTIAIVS